MARVYFTDLRTNPKRSLLDKIEDLLDRVKTKERIKKSDLTAIKLHFGEKGNIAYIRPVFIRKIADYIKKLGARPFITDTNTLYSGSRSDSVNHINTAVYNGFDYASTGCPIIIADGIRGSNSVKVSVDGEILKDVSIAGDIVNADSLVVVTHFKGHELSGFGGALKNIGMGCASREGKLIQHSNVAPKVNGENCKGCGLCTGYCSVGAISIMEKKAFIDPERCIGCGECIIICPFKAIEIQWNEPQDVFQKKMVEHAAGVLKGKEKRTIFINFLTQISPACDCYPNNDSPIVRDIGIVASIDPVSIDAASCDLVNNEESLPNTAIKNMRKRGEDKWKALYPTIEWQIQLEHAEKMGLGERMYHLIKV